MGGHVLLKQYQKTDRPRERIRQYGAESLSDCELLAIVLRTGTAKTSVISLANQILAKFSGLHEMREATFEELVEINGIGEAKAAQIFAAIELGKRFQFLPSKKELVVKTSEDVAKHLMSKMDYMWQEHFIVLYLNTKNHVINQQTIFKGSLNYSVVHPREVFREAVRRSAASIICAHNHPSGDPTPSDEDIEVTKRLTECGQMMGIELLDHIIIGKKCYVSLRHKGYM